MIFIKSFSNYYEFKQIFGIVEHGNGAKSRRNKILLACLKEQFKDAVVRQQAGDTDTVLYFQSADALKRYAKRVFNGRCKAPGFLLDNWLLRSNKFKLDALEGICEDGDARSVRYVNNDSGRVFKMKAGKFITKIIEEHDATRAFPEQLKRFLGEEFAREWQAYAEPRVGNDKRYELHVNENFAKIYDEYGDCKGDFGSCMAGNDQWQFYKHAINASAAYLTDEEGYVVARCVIYNKVHETGSSKTYRLAERQYASDGDNVLKQILVNKLIEEGHIDGYKKIGVDCHAHKAYISNDGEDWSDKDFYIHNTLESGDTLSYQDSFIYYNHREGIAWNHSSDHDYTYELDATDSSISIENDVWSDYRGCYIPESQASYDTYFRDHGYDEDIVEYMYGTSTNYRRGNVDETRDEFDELFCHSDYHNSCLLKSDAAHSDCEGDWYFADEVVEVYGGETAFIQNCVKIRDVWYHSSQLTHTVSGLWPKHDTVIVDGVCYRKEDAPKSIEVVSA